MTGGRAPDSPAPDDPGPDDADPEGPITEDPGATSTHRPDAPPSPDESTQDPFGDVELEREPDGSYRVVRRVPRRPDGDENTT